jgi:phage gp16-like protein
MKLAPDLRSKQLGLIHIGANALGMDTKDENPDCEYRSMLWTLGRVRSAAHLDFAGRKAVIDHLKARGGFKARPRRHNPDWDWVNAAAADRQPMLRKCAVILRDAGRGKEYVDGVAKKMFGILVVEFCAPDQLHDIVSALVKDQQRRQNRAAATLNDPRTTNHEPRI